MIPLSNAGVAGAGEVMAELTLVRTGCETGTVQPRCLFKCHRTLEALLPFCRETESQTNITHMSI